MNLNIFSQYKTDGPTRQEVNGQVSTNESKGHFKY